MNKTTFDPSSESEEFMLKYLSNMKGSQSIVDKVCEDHKDQSMTRNEAELVYNNLF